MSNQRYMQRDVCLSPAHDSLDISCLLCISVCNGTINRKPPTMAVSIVSGIISIIPGNCTGMKKNDVLPYELFM